MRTTFDITLDLLVMDERGEELGESTEMEMLFADGSHVHHGEVEELTGEEHDITHGWTPEDETLVWDGANKYVGITRVNSDQFPQIVDLDWEILVTQDVEVANAAVQSQVLASVGIGLVVILVGGAMAAFLGQTIATPVLTLTGVAQSFAGGDYDARADISSRDEIGQLAAAFNKMAEEVGTQTVALAERGREMEASQRVTFAASERTTPDDFLNLLVNLIADQFDVYHCQVYLVDEDKRAAVLSQSTGYAGRQLLQRGHAIPLEAQSLVTQCINTGESVLVAETTKDPNWLPNPLLPYTQSELVVPLKIDDKVIGAMDIQDRVAERFTSETVPVFESMTEHVAFLYQNNELLEDIEEAQRTQEQFVTQLETTSEVAGELNTILDPTQLLDQSVTMLQSRFNFYHAHIYLVDEEKQNLVVASGSGNVGVILKDRGHSIPVTAEKSFVATAYRNASAVRVGDTAQDPNWLPNPLLPDTRAEMAVPLITRGQVIGVLDIQDEVVGRFTEVDEDTMLTLAGQLATSVDTARLFVDVEHTAERDRTRFEIAEALSGNPTEEEVWDVLLEKSVGENLLVTLSLVDKQEDGSVITTIHRSVSSDPAMTPPPVGQKLNISEAPGFVDRVGMLLINDVSTDEQIAGEYAAYLKSQGVASMMYAPFALVEGDEWQGMIRVSSKEVGYFDADRASMYDALIELGTVALRSARLRAVVEGSADRDRTRFEIAEALSGNPTEEEVWDILLEKAMGGNVAVTLSLAEFTEDGGVKTVSHRSASSTLTLEAPPVGETLVIPDDPDYKILDFNEVFISNDVENDERIRPESRKGITSRGVVSLLTTPITISDEGDWKGGVIRVGSSQPDFFDENQVSRYTTLIELGTVALRSARLRASIAQEQERTEILYQVSNQLNAAQGMEDVLQAVSGFAMDNGAYSTTLMLLTMDEAGQPEWAEVTASVEDEAMATTVPVGTKFYLPDMPFTKMWIANQFNCQFVSNVETDENLDEISRAATLQSGAKALTIVPLSQGDNWLGFMTFNWAKAHDYSPMEQELYDAFIGLTSQAVAGHLLQEDIVRREERFRALFNYSPDAVLVLDTETGMWLDGNTNASEMFALSREALLETGPAELSPSHQPNGRESAEYAIERINEALESGTNQFEWVHRDAKGKEFDCEIRLAILPGGDNNLLVNITDVTETKATQEAIRDSQQRLSLLVQQSPVAVIEWNTKFEVVDWNPSAEHIFGFSKKEAVGKHAAGLIIPVEAKAAVDEVWANLLKQKGGERSTNDNLTKDGRTISCEWYNTPLTNDEGEVFGVASLVLDITDRKEAEMAIVQGDRLKSEFLANMSHELRTPLNSILGYTDVLLMGLDGELDEEVTTDLEAIHENSQHLLNLINDILDLAKIEANRMTFELGEVNVSHLLSEVKKTSAGLLVNKDVEMLIEADDKLPQMMADYHRVYQVVNNLVSNAVKFTEKGTITLRALAEGDEMVLQVVDTGIGISDEDLEVIFEEFTQADTSSTRQHEGTGLGLTITRRLVQLHGGTITVESELGKGSTFTARFPMQAKVNPELLIVVQSPNGNK
jgi:PAS domain S-box-containing protein